MGDQDAAQVTQKAGETDATLIDYTAKDKLTSRGNKTAQKVVVAGLGTPTLKLKDKKAAQKTNTLKTREKSDVQISTEEELNKDISQNSTQKAVDIVAAQDTSQIGVDKVFKKTITPNELLIEDAVSSLSHDELLEITKSSLFTLTCCDSLLSDLPEDVLLEEVLSHIAVEHGQAITIFISREDEPQLKVIVPQTSTVRELKKAINRHFEMYQKRKRNKVKISWKYIWRTYDLSYDGIILDNDTSSIDDYNITNKVTLSFKKKKKKGVAS